MVQLVFQTIYGKLLLSYENYFANVRSRSLDGRPISSAYCSVGAPIGIVNYGPPQDYGPPLWPGGATSLQEYENAIAKMNSKKSPTQKKKEDLVVDEVTKDSQQNEGTSVLDSRDKTVRIPIILTKSIFLISFLVPILYDSP